jgi:hypothetical protein
MSSVVISGDSSGQVSLTVPSAAGTNTATLPAATGTVMVSGNMPAFSAYASSGQTVTTGTWTKIQVNTKEFDTATCFNTSTYAYTPNVAGYYQVNAQLHMATGINGRLLCSIYKNGSIVKIGSDASNNNTLGVNLSILIYMNGSTDYIEFWGYQDAGSSKALDNSSAANYFQASLVRAS